MAQPAEELVSKIDFEAERKAMWERDVLPNMAIVHKVIGLCAKANSQTHITILYKKTDSDAIILRGGYYRQHDSRTVWLSGTQLADEVSLQAKWLKYSIANIQSAYVTKPEADRIKKIVEQEGNAPSTSRTSKINKSNIDNLLSALGSG